MRTTWIFAVALFFAASCSDVQAQRQRSKLQQMLTDWADDMGDMASRIGYGFLRTVNRNNEAGLGRQRPLQRQQVNPNENDILPNGAPKPVAGRPPQNLRQNPRQRLTFRRFVDGVFSGLSNIMPRLRRRVFNRNNRGGGQVSQSPRRIRRSTLGIPQGKSLSLKTGSSGLTVTPAVQVSVNIFQGALEDGTLDHVSPVAENQKPVEEVLVNYYSGEDPDVLLSSTEDLNEGFHEFNDPWEPVRYFSDDNSATFSFWDHDNNFDNDKLESPLSDNDQSSGEIVFPHTDQPPDSTGNFDPTEQSSDDKMTDKLPTFLLEATNKYEMLPIHRSLVTSPTVDSNNRYRSFDDTGYLQQEDILIMDESNPYSRYEILNSNTETASVFDNPDILSSVYLSHMYDNDQSSQASRPSNNGDERLGITSYPVGFKNGFIKGFQQGFDSGRTESRLNYQVIRRPNSPANPNVYNVNRFRTQSSDRYQFDNSNVGFKGNNKHRVYDNHQLTHFQTNGQNIPQIDSTQHDNSQSNNPNNMQVFNDQSHHTHVQQPQSNSELNFETLFNSDWETLVSSIPGAFNNGYQMNRPSGTPSPPSNPPHNLNNQQNVHTTQHLRPADQEPSSSSGQVNLYTDRDKMVIPGVAGLGNCDGHCLWSQLMQYLDHFSNDSENRRRRTR